MISISDIERPVDYLVDLCARYDVDKLMLFGSRARGDNGPRSDIDIAVFASSLSLSEFSRLLDEINGAPTLLKIDVVMVTSQTSHQLLENIEKEGIVLYAKV